MAANSTYFSGNEHEQGHSFGSSRDVSAAASLRLIVVSRVDRLIHVSALHVCMFLSLCQSVGGWHIYKHNTHEGYAFI